MTTNYVDTITNSVVTSLDVLKSVNDMYSSEFTRLLTVMGLLVGFGGVVLPILIQLYQNRVIKNSESELKAEMAKLLDEKKAELLGDVEKKFNAEKEIITASLKENIATIEKQQNKAQGDVFQLQAANRKEDDLAEKCHDLCMAAGHYCKSDGGADLSRVIKVLTIAVLPKLNKEALEKDGLGNRLDTRLEKILIELQKWNHNDLLFDLIYDFEMAIKEAKGRK